jgi:Ca2+-binding RTX toxin-like protein
MLTGGAGSDTFDFNALSEMGLTSTTWDVINDFVHGLDRIDLSTLDANAALAGNQAFSAPVVGGTFSGALPLPAICTSTTWRMSSTATPTPTRRRNSRFSSSG